jgi:uncharacterized protein with ParB-like and HNH nuclease domain
MEMSPKPTSLASLVGVQKKQLLIPPYQRPYAWERDQVEELIDDLRGSIGSDHFMGTLVLNTKDSFQPVVIDGQQRITTIFLLLAVIRDVHAKLESGEDIRIQYSYLQNQWPEEGREFKLRTGESNWPVFLDYILRHPTEAKRKAWSDFEKVPRKVRKPNRRLAENFACLSEFVNGEISHLSDSGKLKRLKQIEEVAAERFKFLQIEVPEVEDAFLIFETLNDRGLALSAGDLLKNHLLALASKEGAKIESMAEEWDEMVESLSSADLTKFLRHYLLAKHPKVTKDDVFPLFKIELKNGVSDVFESLKTMARHYGEFLEPAAETPPKIVKALKSLQQLRAAICYSVLLPAREYLTDADFYRVVRLIEVLTFRYSSVCGKASNVLEQTYHKAAKELESSKGSNLDAAIAELLKLMPSSEEFTAAFKMQAMGNKDICVYMLREIEESLDDEKSANSSAKVHIEHIMPQVLSEDWKLLVGTDGEKRFPDYVDKWGNLTLLSGRKNNALRNGPFAKKKEVYKASSFKITQQLTSLDNWDFDAITERQTSMAEQADKVWQVSAVLGTAANA